MEKFTALNTKLTSLNKELISAADELLKKTEQQYKLDGDPNKVRKVFATVSEVYRGYYTSFQDASSGVDKNLSKILANAPASPSSRRNSVRGSNIAQRLSQVFQQTPLADVVSKSDTKPIPFIQPAANSSKLQLVINEEAAAMISEISSEVIVIAIAGMYRTGKSYLLNRLFSKQKGFDIGASVQACTKGIWIWGKPSQQKDEPFVVLMDTEGLGDPQQVDNSYDPIIFSLSILLSSYFIYNSLGTINDPAIQQLSLVTKLTERIKAKSSSSDDAGLDEHFPPFMWVVRDFNLMLVDKAGKPLTEKEYLEDSLKNKPGYSKEVQERNNVLNALRGFFTNRDCAVLPRPVGTEEDLQRLEDLPVWHLHPEFKNKMSALTQKILTTAPVKTVCGHKITGNVLVLLARAYVKAINENAVPTIHSAYESVVLIECESAKKESVNHYRKEMETFVAKAKGEPIAADALAEHHTKILQEAINKFVARAIGDEGNKIQMQLQDEIADYTEHGQLVAGVYASIWQANERCTYAHSTKMLADLHATRIAPKILNRAYFAPTGAYADYEKDMGELLKLFEMKKRGFVWKSAEALSQFLEAKKKESEQLIADGAFIDAKNKELADIQMKNQLEKALREKKEAELKNMHNQLIEQNNSHLAHVNALQQQQQRDLESARVRNENLMNQRLQEQQSLLQSGFAAEAARKQSQIDNLNSQYNSLQANNQQMLNSLNSQLASVQEQLKTAVNRPPQHHHHQSHHHHGGCFSPSTKANVQLNSKMIPTKLADLRVGDRVEVAGPDGSLTVSEVYWLEFHTENVEMVEIVADDVDGKTFSLKLTCDHLVYISFPKAKGMFDRPPIEAAKLSIGDSIWVKREANHKNELRKCIITQIHNVEEKGMVNVFTLENNILANNILASCHIVNHNWQVLDAMLIRTIYKISPSFSSSSTFKNAVKKWDSIFEGTLLNITKKL